jgi:hypothetical protein
VGESRRYQSIDIMVLASFGGRDERAKAVSESNYTFELMASEPVAR